MLVNNFKIISKDVSYENSSYNLSPVSVGNCTVYINKEIVNKLDIEIQPCCFFKKDCGEWLGAFYMNKINPSNETRLSLFENDLNAFVRAIK